MSRFIQKRGFSLAETAVVIAVIGCLAAFGIGMFNANKFSNETLAIKQTKLESALKAATNSIVGGEKLSAEEACDARGMRDKYLDKLANSREINDIVVNGNEVPALEIIDVGVVGFDTTADCRTTWYTSSGAVSGGGSIESAVNLEKSLVIYASIGDETSDISVPGYAAAKTSTMKAVSTNNVLAYAVSSNSRLFNTFSSVDTNVVGLSELDNTEADCIGGAYSGYTPSTCGEDGGCCEKPAYYQMLAEKACALSFCPGNAFNSQTGEYILSGKVNLICGDPNQNGTANQCTCPQGKSYYFAPTAVDTNDGKNNFLIKGVYVEGICLNKCSDLSDTLVDSGSSCVCPDDKPIWSNVQRKCISTDDCGQDFLEWNSVISQCVCKSEEDVRALDGGSYIKSCEEYDATNIVSCKRVISPWQIDSTTGECICPVNYANPETCACEEPRSIFENGECKCNITDEFKANLAEDEIIDINSANCKAKCSGDEKPNANQDGCIPKSCENPLMSYMGSAGCQCDARLAGNGTYADYETFSPTSETCKACSPNYPNRAYNQEKTACVCKAQSLVTIAANEIYDANQANCVLRCTGRTVPNETHTRCIDIPCLKNTDDNINGNEYCNPDPSNIAAQCLDGTNEYANPNDPSGDCSTECPVLKKPTANHMSCECDPSQANDPSILSFEKFDATQATCKNCKFSNRTYNSGRTACECKPKAEITLAPNQVYNISKDNCIEECTGRTVPNADQTACEEIPCLKNTDDNIRGHEYCNPDPSNIAHICLDGTNEYANPNDPSGDCSTECPVLKKPTANHMSCECDPSQANDPSIMSFEKFDATQATCKNCKFSNRVYNSTKTACECKTKAELDAAHLIGPNQVYNVNENNCIQTCTGQTIPNQDHTACIPVDCLKVTTNNISQQCAISPSDEKLVECLEAKRTWAWNQDMATSNTDPCSEDCSAYKGKVPELPYYRRCVCDITAMVGQYSSDNMKFDPNAANCESPCPTVNGQNILVRINDDTMAESCKCPARKPSFITVQAGYYYDETSKQFSGNIACQKECPTEEREIDMWKRHHYMDGYDTYRADMIGCICEHGSGANNNCPAGTYFDEPNCECVPCTKGHYCPPATVVPVECPCGTYNDQLGQDELSDCKACPQGYHCPAASESSTPVANRPSPIACTAGELCPEGTCNPDNCGGIPATSQFPFVECICASRDAIVAQYPNYFGEHQEYVNNLTSVIGTKKCIKCSEPYTKLDGTACTCKYTIADTPAGKYFDAANCRFLDCPVGHYCPGGTPNPTDDPDKDGIIPCPCGTYNAATGKSKLNECLACPQGYHCPEASESATPIAGRPSAVACTAGQLCPAGTCNPDNCGGIPATSESPFVECVCASRDAIVREYPNYFGEYQEYVADLNSTLGTKKCIQCVSNRVYDATTQKCVCPADTPYWNGTECVPCDYWGMNKDTVKLFFARQSENNSGCKLKDHLKGDASSGCFDYRRVVTPEMKDAADALSSADANRTFNGVYAYIVAYDSSIRTGNKAKVVGVFTTTSWYLTFTQDEASWESSQLRKTADVNGKTAYISKKTDILAAANTTTCDSACANLSGTLKNDCLTSCQYFRGHITTNTMFSNCKHAAVKTCKDRYGNDIPGCNEEDDVGKVSNDARDERCEGGQILVQLGSYQCPYAVGGIIRKADSPIVLDLKGNGFKFTSVEDGVIFDLNNDGVPEKSAWTGKQKSFDNAFLVLDKNKNGQVDNGGELFGDQNGQENGFLELAKYDDNGDKIINEQDKVYNELLLWVDFNNNAKVDYEADGTTKEIKTLPEAGVTELSVNYKIEKDSNGNILRDIYGNITGFIGSFKMMIQDAAGKLVEVVRKMMDVFFITQ